MEEDDVKCRICLESESGSKQLTALNGYISSELKTYSEIYHEVTTFPISKMGPQNLCKTCVDDLIAAYSFKKRCEKSEMILNGFADIKSENIGLPLPEESIEIELKPDPDALIYSSTVVLEKNNLNFDETLYKQKSKKWAKPPKNVFKDENGDSSKLTKKKLLDCPYCEAKLVNNMGLRRHCRRKHNDHKQVCQVCSKEFYSVQQLENHVQKAHNTKRKIMREKIEIKDSDGNLLQVKRIKRRILHCQHCAYECNDRETLDNHYKEMHKGEKIQCPSCDVQYDLPSQIRHHRRTIHGYTENKKAEKTVCCHCGKILCFVSLDTHIRRVHKNETTTFICDVCGSKFGIKHSLVVHMHLKHIGAQFKCRYCDETYPSGGMRRTHEYRFHTFAYKHKCNICDLKFLSNCSLKQHLLTHTGEKNWKCDVCGLYLSTKHTLIRHQAVHTNLRPFICEICASSYKTKKALYVHKRIHTDKSYECPVCFQKYTSNQQMRQHCIKSHPEHELPPPGTIMNKNAIKRNVDKNEKYNVNYELPIRMPKLDEQPEENAFY